LIKIIFIILYKGLIVLKFGLKRGKKMKKIAILLIALMVICVGLLSGCTDNGQQDENPPIAKDTDEDGYTDDIDDFPLDNTLHEKAPFSEFNPLEYNITLAPGIGQGPYSEPNITSDWKYVICNWYVTEPVLTNDQAKSVLLDVRNPITEPRITTYYYNDSDSHKLTFPINNDNLGVWGFEFANIMAEGIDASPVTVTIHVELYKIR